VACAALCLTVRPHRERGSYHVDRFDAYLSDELIATSRQPLLEGARALLARGVDPEALLTMRAHGRAYDSFHAKPIRAWAQWTITERDRDGLCREKWPTASRRRFRYTEGASSAEDDLAAGRYPGDADDAPGIPVWGRSGMAPKVGEPPSSIRRDHQRHAGAWAALNRC
jgi:hypothetical protein